MKCIECGHELKDGAVFCIRCGAMQVSMDGSAEQANNATVRPAVTTAQGSGGRHTAGKDFKPTPRRNTASVAVPIVAAVAVVAAVGALGAFVLAPASSGDGSSSSAAQVQVSSGDSSSASSASASSASASSSSASSSSASASSSSASSSAARAASGSSASSAASAGAQSGNSAGANNVGDANNAQPAQPVQTYVEPEPEPEPVLDSTYYLADSASRYYSKAELESLSDYDLYYARNEIFARHGRMFQTPELQAYFNSKSWYTPIYTPAQWNAMASPLSDIEQQNSKLMLQVETARNSPYLK